MITETITVVKNFYDYNAEPIMVGTRKLYPPLMENGSAVVKKSPAKTVTLEASDDRDLSIGNLIDEQLKCWPAGTSRETVLHAISAGLSIRTRGLVSAGIENPTKPQSMSKTRESLLKKLAVAGRMDEVTQVLLGQVSDEKIREMFRTIDHEK